MSRILGIDPGIGICGFEEFGHDVGCDGGGDSQFDMSRLFLPFA